MKFGVTLLVSVDVKYVYVQNTISEKSKFENICYIYKNDQNVAKLHFHP